MSSRKDKFFSIDSIYFFSSIFLLLLMVNDFNYLDLLYFILVTVYYIRVKVHRRKS